MAITYVNNLGLSEMATGDNSGTWGNVTNVNLELIGQALGHGTRAIANASTDNITMSDGTADDDRALYLKLTGGGQACTVTLLPATMSKVWIMENGTAAALTFTQGSGANVTIPAGDTKVIACTGGAGTAQIVYDVFASLSVVDLKVQDDLTVTDDVAIGGTLGVTGIATFTDDIIIGDGKTIGSASDVDAMSISSGGVVNFSARPTFAASLTIQDGGSLGSASDLNAMTISSGGVVAVTATTASTSSTTGALTVGGGLGVAADLFVGDDFDVAGDAVIDLTCLVTGVLTTTAATVFSGGFASNAASSINSTTNSPVTIKSTHATGGYAELQLGANGATIGYLGSGESLVGGAAADLTLRAQANLLFGSGGGSERMRLSNLGQVNIRKGSQAIVTPLQFDGLVIQNDDATGIRIISDEGNANEGHAGFGVDNGALTISAKGQISFDTGFLPTDQLFVGRVERFNIASGGDVTVKTGNLVIGTAGKGINFQAYGSGTNIDSNLLDDYEEGTFTPVLTVPSGSIGYAYQTASYTRVGRLVSCVIALNINSISSPSGNTGITGLPFPADSGENFVASVTFGIIRNFVSNLSSVRGFINSNQATITLTVNNSDVDYSNLNANQFQADTLIYLGLTYHTDT